METCLLPTKVSTPSNPSVSPSGSSFSTWVFEDGDGFTISRHSREENCRFMPPSTGGRRMVQVRASDSGAKRVVPSYANYAVPIENQSSSSFITRPLAEILRDMNKRVPDKVLKISMDEGVPMKYIPCSSTEHTFIKSQDIHNVEALCVVWSIAGTMPIGCSAFYAPGWSGEIRNITFSANDKTVTVVYRVTLRGSDGEAWREASGTATIDDRNFGDYVQNAEGIAFRRACARFGLGLYLYHEDETQ